MQILHRRSAGWQLSRKPPVLSSESSFKQVRRLIVENRRVCELGLVIIPWRKHQLVINRRFRTYRLLFKRHDHFDSGELQDRAKRHSEHLYDRLHKSKMPWGFFLPLRPAGQRLIAIYPIRKHRDPRWFYVAINSDSSSSSQRLALRNAHSSLSPLSGYNQAFSQTFSKDSRQTFVNGIERDGTQHHP